ncbi:hypothetical protein C8J56DRAFT_896599 [Mycena floridula]|nr:hypothetical protein C8J56DRAFT_896599 [Mycena floridula]
MFPSDAVNAPMFSHNTMTTVHHQHYHFPDETQYQMFLQNEWQSTLHKKINRQSVAGSGAKKVQGGAKKVKGGATKVEGDDTEIEVDTDNISLYSSGDESLV